MARHVSPCSTAPHSTAHHGRVVWRRSSFSDPKSADAPRWAADTCLGLAHPNPAKCLAGDTTQPLAVDFAAADVPLDAMDYVLNPDLQMYPTVATAIVPVCNLNAAANLTLSARGGKVAVLRLPFANPVFLGHIGVPLATFQADICKSDIDHH